MVQVPGATGVTAYFEQAEYGTSRITNITNPSRYGWVGNSQRSSDAMAGLILMGVRLYNPLRDVSCRQIQ